MHGDSDQLVIEAPAGLTISPSMICGYCGAEIAVDQGEVTIKEALHAC